MTTPYRASLAVGGSDAAAMVKNYELWSFERRMKLSGDIPPWMRKEPTDAMKFGTNVHLAILEPEKYFMYRRIVPWDLSFATKAGIDFKKKFEEEHARNPDVFLLKEQDEWAINQILESCTAAQRRGEINLTGGEPEVEVYGLIESRYEAKGMIDLLTDLEIIDIKTTRDIRSAEDLIMHYAYNVQIFHYNRLAPRPRHTIVFIESVPPFRIKKVSLDKWAMNDASARWHSAMFNAKVDSLLTLAPEKDMIDSF